MKKAVLIGATGEMGRNILKVLLEKNYYDKKYILGRQSIKNIPNYSKAEKIIVDFENLKFDTSILNNADIFSTLGSRKNINFEKTDYEYVINFAKICGNKTKSFNIISSIIANKNSKFSYSRAKGKTEETLKTLNLGAIRIYKPAALIAPHRQILLPFEKLSIILFSITENIFFGPLKNFRAIRPYTLAKVIVNNAILYKPSNSFKYRDIINN